MTHPRTWTCLSMIAGLTILASSALGACPGGPQTELDDCAVADYRAIDARMTTAYAKLERTPALITSERAWIADRDAECAYERHASPDGSMYPAEEANSIRRC